MAKKVVECPSCKEAVEVKTFSIPIFLLLLPLGFFPAIIYFLWRVYGTKKCPNCHRRI